MVKRKFTKDKKTDVVVIGGGITGVGIARDAAMRGFKVILVESKNLGSGTSGYFHGLLHSGARYAITDPQSAKECYEENKTLRHIAKPAVLDTGGYFLALTKKEEKYSSILYKACKQIGIPTKDIPLTSALKKEPNITPHIKRVISVPDGYIDGIKLLELNKIAAKEANQFTQFLTHHQVIKFYKKNDFLEAVIVKDKQTDEEKVIQCNFVINAGGIWASKISQLADINIDLIADKGVMLVFEKQLSKVVLNRCHPAADGDILVPTGKYSIMGTTSLKTKNIDTHEVTQWEIDKLLQEGAEMVPLLPKVKVLYSYAGVRPLSNSILSNFSSSHGRTMSRSFRVLDHEVTNGLKNFISIIGGKATIYRLMAEKTVDLMCSKLNSNKKSQTANVLLAD